MVKIEKLLDGAVATITREGQPVRLVQGVLINYYDLSTLNVVGGKLIYSIDETEVVEVIGIPAVTGGEVTKEVEAIVSATEVVDTVTTAEAATAETVNIEITTPVAAKTTKKK